MEKYTIGINEVEKFRSKGNRSAGINEVCGSQGTCPPARSNTAKFPSEMVFNPLYSDVLSSAVETPASGTGSIAGK